MVQYANTIISIVNDDPSWRVVSLAKIPCCPPYKIRTRDVKSNGSSASLLYIFFTQIKGARISKRNAYDTNAVMAYYKKNVFEGELT